MEIKFKMPVTFSTIHQAFSGAGIPPIPEDATRLVVSSSTVAYVSSTGEVWECYLGNGTSQTSHTYYWPARDLCPRAWAEEK